MAHLLVVLLRAPFQTCAFLYVFIAQVVLVLLKRLLLPHFPIYQSLRLQVQRAYLSSASLTYPELVHRLPVTTSEQRAQRVGNGNGNGNGWTGYLIPGHHDQDLRPFTQTPPDGSRCVVLYAHGGGYARGEARMYIPYMERWVACAAEQGILLLFLSVEYPLTSEAPHPAQRDSFIKAYRHLLEVGVSPESIVFMGDSAGGGLCILSALEAEKQGLPQPAASILISPWMDMSLRSFQGGNALVETDYVATANTSVPMFVRMFLGQGQSQHKGDSPDVNPLYRTPESLRYLNPQLVLVGAAEFTLQESKDWAALCLKAGVEHELVVEWGQLHVYALGSSFLDPEVRRKTDQKVVGWISRHIKSYT
ncbi:hypothetical protein A1O3_00258 [Capronia epimyces CBS 606.96]|uniref:Alpha/beta hydrolase fold-3 domain-containing protein n=1 Tax=Capronia epimyces CBS 606.96 TaxID=1182542 RepID=W9YGN0_9EURO|nr:uncharacterized protein A1O3_00258 [Capronia epimyces CBS 606.96]EXJ91708.1 hypothetical protein A1O3_00258 [Capronia epimyces CBS 606.96]